MSTAAKLVTRGRILLADDDPDLLLSLSAALRANGADVVSAATGAELLDRLAHEGPFDLVVTDISMPWMTGLQVANYARVAGLDTPIIVMTALRDDRIAQQVNDLGDRAVLLRKPFSLPALLEAVDTLLADAEPVSRT